MYAIIEHTSLNRAALPNTAHTLSDVSCAQIPTNANRMICSLRYPFDVCGECAAFLHPTQLGRYACNCVVALAEQVWSGLLVSGEDQ